jgi:hypothetical protein
MSPRSAVPAQTAAWPEAALAAAREAVAPAGPVPWFLEPVDGRSGGAADGLALRMTVRRWARAVEPQARLARLACGTALHAVRLAVAAQGRRPVVSTPGGPSGRPGLVAVVRAGHVAAPRPAERAAYAALLDPTARPPLETTAAMPHLRQAAEAEGAWLTAVRPGPCVRGEILGPRWPGGDSGGPDTVTLVMGVPGTSPWVEVQAGQAVEAVVLAARTAGSTATVLAAPANPETVRRRLMGGEPWRLHGAVVVLRLA